MLTTNVRTCSAVIVGTGVDVDGVEVCVGEITWVSSIGVEVGISVGTTGEEGTRAVDESDLASHPVKSKIARAAQYFITLSILGFIA